jgi:hypothetical protein
MVFGDIGLFDRGSRSSVHHNKVFVTSLVTDGSFVFKRVRGARNGAVVGAACTFVLFFQGVRPGFGEFPYRELSLRRHTQIVLRFSFWFPQDLV